MLTRSWFNSYIYAVTVLFALFTISCEKVPLLAPTGSSITVSAGNSVLSATGSTTLIAQVLEQPGTPPHSGTQVTFTTSLGRVEPAQVETDVSGRATAKFVAGGSNGTATIGALSGGATTGSEGTIQIAVGTAAVGSVSVIANPNPVSASNPVTTVTVNVLDLNGNPLDGTPVSFTANVGTLSAGVMPTASNGRTQVNFTTTQQAIVTASVGVTSPTTNDNSSSSGQRSGTVTVNVTAAPTITITPPATVTEGLPAAFTITVTPASTNAASVRDVVVDWGDGSTQNLGSFVGSQPQSHVYDNDGPYVVKATVTDVLGGKNSVSTSIVAVALAKPSISISPSPVTQSVGGSITFTIAISPPAGITVRSASINYGDGSSDLLGGATLTTRAHVYGSAGTKKVTVTVEDTAGQTSVGSASVTITP